MKTLQRLKLGLFVVATLMLTTPATQALADQPGPYYATPSWDQTLQCDTQATCPRFIVLSNWGGAAVLDRETGLVWEKSPSTSTFIWNDQASFHCNNLAVGNRIGWKLPTLQELASLVDRDPANTSNRRLPPGHPFLNVQPSSGYWSASTLASDTSSAWGVSFVDGNVGFNFKSNAFFVWCVRGGPGVDIQ